MKLARYFGQGLNWPANSGPGLLNTVHTMVNENDRAKEKVLEAAGCFSDAKTVASW
jgi:hypothetical protein